MKLYLLRHGDADERSAEGYTTDAARALSPKGIKRTRQLAKQALRAHAEQMVQQSAGQGAGRLARHQLQAAVAP